MENKETNNENFENKIDSDGINTESPTDEKGKPEEKGESGNDLGTDDKENKRSTGNEEGASSFKDGSFSANSESSSTSSYLYETIIKQEDATRKWKTAAKISFILSIASIFVGSIVSAFCALLEINHIAPIVILMLVPIASIVIAVKLIRLREKATKNIVAGCIALLMLFSIMTADTTSVMYNDPENEALALDFLKEAEAALGIDLPEGKNSYYYEYSVTREFSTDLDEESLEKMHKLVSENENFVEKFPTPYIGLLPPYERSNDQSAALLFNETTGEYNSIPKTDGTYHFFYIYFYEDEYSAHYYVFEYDMEYVSSFSKAGTSTPDI